MLFQKSRIFTFTALAVITLSNCNPKQNQEEMNLTETAPVPFVKVVPEWSKSANIYEINIRQHTAEGTFVAAQKDLVRLREMGVDILWIMPIHPIGELNRKGGKGSYYSVRDYKAVNPEFGTLDDFKTFVKSAQELGMKVIIDWVANHTSFDHVWATEHKDWYTLDENGNLTMPAGTDWSDVADLNYDNMDMREAMIDALKYWVKEVGIDGYRCDVASFVPTDFWNKVREELDAIKPVFMLAESEEIDLHEKAFDMTYAWDFHHLTNKLAKGEKKVADIKPFYENDLQKFGKEAYRMVFTTNHDENSWNGTMQERYGRAFEPMNVLSFTLYGMPLVYSGQEGGETKRLSFFEKDQVNWNKYALQPFFNKLLTLKKENKALWNGAFGGDVTFIETGNEQVLAFYRNKEENTVVVIINFSDKAQTISARGSEGSMKAKELFSGEEVELVNPTNIKLGPFGYKVFHSIN